jgi:membrane-associated phospholipid phosphatase
MPRPSPIGDPLPPTTVDPPPGRPPAGSRRSPLPIVAACVGAVLVLGSWALLDGRHRVPGWETDLFHAANDLPDVLAWPLVPIMQLGTFWMVSVTGVIAWLLTRRAGPTLGAVFAVTGAWLLAHVVKDQVGRTRPDDLLAGVDVRGAGAEGNGYVSGHSAVAFAAATVVTPLLPGRWRILPLTLAALVAFARVYVGVHLPLDVVGGAGVGILSGLVAAVLTGRADRPGREAGDRAGTGRERATR